MTTFTWTEDFGSAGDEKAIVQVVKLGDGYEQRYGVGLHATARTENVIFGQRDEEEWQAIVAFLQARGGTEAFLWTPALESDALVVVCDGFNRTKHKGGRCTVTAQFRQVFEP